MRVRSCRFHEDVSRFIVAKIVGKTGFLSPMRVCMVFARVMHTCDRVPEKKSVKERTVN